MQPFAYPVVLRQTFKMYRSILCFLTAQRRSNILALTLVLLPGILTAQQSKKFKEVLGVMPAKPALRVDTLEKKALPGGWRYRLRYLAEESDPLLHTPKDYGYAYLFIPEQAREKKTPGIVAIHQDGNHNYIGYHETAGIMGDADQHYGLELFQRGYIVICPDRFLHAERRRIANPDTLADVFKEADIAEQHWVGQLQLRGRNFVNKEVYDLMLATDILCQVKNLDKDNIGAVGHSAGGYILPYFMFMDNRIKAGVSSCGVFEVIDWFAEDAIMKRNMFTVIPNLANVGRTSDYIGLLAPRPFLMTRGLHEWGDGNEKQKFNSKRHVAGTEMLDKEARKYYSKANADKNLKTIYFDENGGTHSFPPKVKEEAFLWLDGFLKER